MSYWMLIENVDEPVRRTVYFVTIPGSWSEHWLSPQDLCRGDWLRPRPPLIMETT